MCNFLSAIWTRPGKLICEPTYTDSHSDLIEAFGLREKMTTAPVQDFVRLELTLPDGSENEFFDFAKWREQIDEREVPTWFDDAARFDAFESMRELLAAARDRSDKSLVLGSLVFAKASAMRVIGCRVTAWSGSNVTAYAGSNVTARSGN